MCMWVCATRKALKEANVDSQRVHFERVSDCRNAAPRFLVFFRSKPDTIVFDQIARSSRINIKGLGQ